MKRYFVLDGIRGLALISMIVYHGIWDLVYLFSRNWSWYESPVGYWWQQSICWTFILVSGFCWSFSKRKWKRGMITLLSGFLITAVTLIAMPEERVIFGVLTLLGSSMLLLTLLEPFLKKCNPTLGLVTGMACFLILRNCNQGYLGFESWNLIPLPGTWYQNLATAFLGFPPSDFFSTDYFSLLPWFFLFLSGYFGYRIMEQRDRLTILQRKTIRPLEWIGQHSLPIYLLHQPVLYVLLQLYVTLT